MGSSSGPPTCRLCKVAHWSTEPHKFGPAPKPTVEVLKAVIDKVSAGETAEEKLERLRIEGLARMKRYRAAKKASTP